ncbi:hypothetical protein ACWF95_39090 [Streptomyces vinaceus]
MTALGSLMTVGAAQADSSSPVISETLETEFAGFHGVKPGDVDKLLEKIERPEGGSAGNPDPDWKAFYLTSNPFDAAGYAVGEDGKTAGGVVRVLLPEVKIVEVDSSASVKTLKTHFGIPEGEHLMDALGSKNIALRMDGGAGYDEIIVPWSIATKGRAEVHVNWTGDPRGAESAHAWVKKYRKTRP